MTSPGDRRARWIADRVARAPALNPQQQNLIRSLMGPAMAATLHKRADDEAGQPIPVGAHGEPQC